MKSILVELVSMIEAEDRRDSLPGGGLIFLGKEEVLVKKRFAWMVVNS